MLLEKSKSEKVQIAVETPRNWTFYYLSLYVLIHHD
ncbi:hypothetical protein HPL003_11000 [Paenibacillus terrae HPL-003]|uniref:Uncharacterized protein n=1 Tax=Paenibacillus terrae (strain HPL-003) TaxID=985665 RepID=G7VXB8_PAETH|nr:hypothetical protein HPL003_11000 [Paenibacillus terrae HPL-003]